MKIEIRSRTKPERERFFKKRNKNKVFVISLPLWRAGGETAAHPRSRRRPAGFVSRLGWRDAIGTLMEVYDAARDTPAAADAQ